MRITFRKNKTVLPSYSININGKTIGNISWSSTQKLWKWWFEWTGVNKYNKISKWSAGSINHAKWEIKAEIRRIAK